MTKQSSGTERTSFEVFRLRCTIGITAVVALLWLAILLIPAAAPYLDTLFYGTGVAALFLAILWGKLGLP